MRLDRYLQLCAEEALRGIWYHRRTAAPAVAIIAVSLTVLGAFLLVSDNLGRLLGRWRERGQVQVFLSEQIEAPDLAELNEELRSHPAVASYDYLSSEEAAERFRADFGGLGEFLDLLDENPLPASFAVTVTQEYRSEMALQGIAETWESLDGVEDVQFDLQIIRRLELGVRVVRLVGWILGATVLAAAVITTANVIRVLVVARRQEIEVMRLVGATEFLVRGRFLFEGLLQGLVGGGVALLVLYAVFRIGMAYLEPGIDGALALLRLRFIGPSPSAALVGGGALAGFLGALLAFGPGSGLRQR